MSLRLALSAALLAGVALVAPAQAAPVPVGATWTEQWITSPDGTPLHADVLLPTARDEREKHPVILSVGPYFGSGTQSAGYSANSAGPSARFRT
jgi:predicted acyl esterase